MASHMWNPRRAAVCLVLLVGVGLPVFIQSQEIADLECEVKKAALAFGAARVTGNVVALERGLNFASNCSHDVPSAGATASWDTAPEAAIQFYVSPTGSDLNDGSKEKPFATLAHARDAIRFERRQLDDAGKTWQGAVVNLLEGKYYMRHPLHLSSEDSGSPDGPIVYQAADRESAQKGKVTLSSRMSVTRADILIS